MSVSELKSLNNLSSDTIYVGQTLKVNGSTSTPAPRPTPSGSTYTVKGGDTLSHVGREYNMSVSELKSLNNLSSDTIYIGQTLKVSGSTSTSAPAPTTPSGSTYTVKSGDTLSHVGREYNMSVSELKALNNLSSDTIYIGQTLRVKGSTSTSAPAPAQSSSSNSTYTVKSGDTISGIARAHNTTVANLVSWNNLENADQISVNQTLTIKKSSQQTSNTNNAQTYRVVSGDTLSAIARRFDTTIHSLKEKNNLKTDLIFVNQIIKI